MQHQYNELKNVRMPRACKKATQYYQHNARRTRASVQHELLQQQQQQNAMYNTITPVQHHYSAYTMPEQRNLHVNHGFEHPNVPHLPSMAPTPHMYAPTPQPQQPMCPRYSTRSVDHNIMMNNNTSHIQPYWRPSLPAQRQIVTPILIPIPPKPIPVQTRESNAQTETPITEEEIKFLEMLRTKNLDVEKIYSILKRSDYVVVFEEVEDDSIEQNSESEATSNNIVMYNAMQQRNDMMTLAYAAELQRRLASMLPNASSLQAIEYRPQDEDKASESSSSTEQESSNETEHSFIESFQSETNGNHLINLNNIRLVPEPAINETTNENTQSLTATGNMNHREQQVPPARFPIPTITDHSRHNNQMRYYDINPHDYGFPYVHHNSNNNNNNNVVLLNALTQCYNNQPQQSQGWGQASQMQNRPPWL